MRGATVDRDGVDWPDQEMANQALLDVAGWLGSATDTDDNAACGQTPEIVRAQLKAAR